MNENSPTPKCPRCGATATADAPDGLCPRCLIALSLATQTEVTGDEVGANGTKVVKPSPPPAPPLEEIAKLFPHLEILELLGQGGMGAVYKARQPKLDRLVALKVLLRRRADGTTDPTFSERFAREARALARLNHPAIVAVYEYGEAGGYPFLLMEYVDGLTLRQLLQRGKLAPEEALAIVPKICEALQFAHQRGIVHRDIKPENVLVDTQGQVKIADFGIAKILAPGAQDFSLTGRKDVVGTPHYMAPEQIEQPAKVDHRADIFSLGVVFYEMLTGELPLGKFAPPSKKVQVDVRLDEVVLRALEKEPERRYQQASQVKTDVETIASSSPPPTSAPALDPQANAQWPNRWEAGLIAAALTVYAVLLARIPAATPPFNHILAFLCAIGLPICALILAGWWPAPSFLVPDSGFARRNLRHASALSGVGFAFACLSGLIPTIFYWLAPLFVPWLTPQGQELALWLTLSAGFVAVVAGVGARQTGLGKSALVVGVINLSLWLLFAVAGSSSAKPFANGKGPSPTVSAPDSVLILRDNLALDLDGQSLVDVSRQSRQVPAQLQAVDVAWDNDGGGVLMRNPRGRSRLLPLPDASDFEHAAALAAQRRKLVEGSEDRGGLASKCRFFAVLSDQDRLAVIEIKEFDPMQATVRWRFVEGPKTGPGTVQPTNPSSPKPLSPAAQAKPGEFKVTLTNDGNEQEAKNWLHRVRELVIERTPWVRGEIRNICLKPRSASEAAFVQATFGPVITRSVSGEGDASQRFIDFDTGRQFAAAEFFGPKAEPSPEETQRWWKQHGIDAMGDTGPAINGLVGFDLVAVPVPLRDGDLKYVRRKQGNAVTEWLFDLGADIAERNHLLAARPTDAQRLRRGLELWETEMQPRR